MSVTYIPVALRRLVEERANQRCEYCQLPVGVICDRKQWLAENGANYHL